MSLLPHCICDPFKAIVGDYDPRCARHLGTPRPTLAQPSVGEYLSACVCPHPCKWCAYEDMKKLNSKQVDYQNHVVLTLKQAALLQEALDIGLDAAGSQAAEYHEAMNGYRPERHKQMDEDAAKVSAAITMLGQLLPPA